MILEQKFEAGTANVPVFCCICFIKNFMVDSTVCIEWISGLCPNVSRELSG